MICPRCGAPTTPADKFCAICASPLGAPPPGYGQAPQGQAPPGYGPPPGYGGGQDPNAGGGQGFGAPPGYGAPGGPPPQGYGPPGGPAQGFAPPGQYGAPSPYGAPPGYGGAGGQQGFGAPPGYGPPGAQGFGQPDANQGYPRPGFGQPAQQPRCVQGHPVPPGASFCIEGHPVAMEGVGDAFGATAFAPPQGGPMPATSAMSGFGGEADRAQGPRPAAGAPATPGPTPGASPQASTLGSAKAPGDRRQLVGFLVSFQDDPLGRFWALWQGKNVVGRAETGQKVDIEIGHGTTSTHHASVECDGPHIVVSDLGSTNGTYCNEEAIGFQGRRELRDGDKIRFGGFTALVVVVAGRA